MKYEYKSYELVTAKTDVKTYGICSKLNLHLIDNSFEGVVEQFEKWVDGVEEIKPPKNLEEILKNLDFCVWSRDNANSQYAQCLRKHGYLLLHRPVRQEVCYFAVHYTYETDFKQNNSHLIPDWAIRSIPYEIYIK